MTDDPRLARPLWRGRTNVDAATIANIEHAEAIVRERWPLIAHEFIVTKGGYQGSSDDASATTHTKGGVADLAWCGHWQCVYALLEAGGFWWHRVAIPGKWNDHIHGGPRGFPAEMQDHLLHLQELAFLAEFDGLGQIPGAPDRQRRPDPLPDLVFPWPPEEDAMPLWSEWPKAEKDKYLEDIAAAARSGILNGVIDKKGTTIRRVLRTVYAYVIKREQA